MIKKLYFKPELKARRVANGYTQDQMAKMLSIQLGTEITRSSYNMWEQTERPVAANVAMAIAQIFAVEPHDLVEGK